MLAGDRASKTDGFVEDFLKRLLDAVHFLVVSLVRKESGMQVAVAHMPESADTKVILFRHLGDKPNHARQFASRYSGILQDRRRGNPGQR